MMSDGEIGEGSPATSSGEGIEVSMVGSNDTALEGTSGASPKGLDAAENDKPQSSLKDDLRRYHRLMPQRLLLLQTKQVYNRFC
uniref:Uncharacterized protein n=1 Tax=Sphaerodactylus townsendi TaxID=933632 RepID=A0ACB8EG53_9SAUR